MTIMRVLPAVVAVAVAGCDRSAALYDAAERGDQGLQRARSKRAVPAEAVEEYRLILDRSPRMGLAHLELALLLHDSTRDYVGAIYHYRRYLELRPDAQKAAMIAARIQDATRRFARQAQGDGRGTNATVAGLSVDAARLVEENASLKIELARLTQEMESLRTHEPANVSAVEQATNRTTATVEQVRVVRPAPAPAPATVARVRTHKVRQKETLSSIAETVYGDRSRWQRILEANSAQLRGDPKRLREGMELTIP